MYQRFRSRAELMLTLLPRPSSPTNVEPPVEETDDFFEHISDDQLFEELDNVLEDLVDLDDPLPLDVEPVVEDAMQDDEELQMMLSSDHPVQQVPRSSSATSDSRPSCSAPIPSRRGSRTTTKRQMFPKKKPKPMKLTWKWTKKGRFKHAVDIPPQENARLLSPALSSDDLDSPLKFFQQFFDEEVVNLILEQTNIYLTTKAGGVAPSYITRQEIFDFILIELYMGVLQAPAYTDYWSKRVRCDAIANTMSLKRYQFIRRHLHFVNNLTADESDRYSKVRDLFNMIRKNFSEIPNTQRQSVDEMMVPYKGTKAGLRKQYCPKKPSKWGFKIFARCGSDGFVYDMIFYDGDRTFDEVQFNETEESLGFGGKVVVALCKSIPDPTLHAVHFDNWFTSLPLMVYLRKHLGILSLGTIRENRLQMNQLPSEKELSKNGRGAIAHTFDNKNKVAVTKWFDNKQVTVATTYVPTQGSTIKRWCKKSRQRVDLPVPQVILEYNKFMGGVDLADMLVSLYRTAYRSHKYYFSIFSQLLDLCVTNAWILYRRHLNYENERRRMENKGIDDEEKKLKPMKLKRLKEFRLDIADSLLFVDRTRPQGRPNTQGVGLKPKKSPSTPLPTSTTRFDQVAHFPTVASKGRCKLCSKLTSIHCLKCKSRMCLVRERNCFLDFHTK